MTVLTMLNWWVAALIVTGIGAGVATGYFKARKIQPRGFKWERFRYEAIVAVVTLLVSGTVLGWVSRTLTQHGIIAPNPAAPAWWQMVLEYALYFFAFDTWFYWLHRWMHKEPVYSWVHKVHHRSTSPNLLTTLSEHPFESFINGGFVPLFLSIVPVHTATVALILPTNIIIMGLYVHLGYEFFPRWWNKSWVTKWFITTTFHDQHHKYFNDNFGGYTTIWDRLCGTMRVRFETDFERSRDQAARPRPALAERTPV